MNENKASLFNILSTVDTRIQKILWVQLVAIIVYGLLFLDGFETRRKSGMLQRSLEETVALRSQFVWLDSLATIFVEYPELGNKYQSYFKEFDNYLYLLKNLKTSSLFYNSVFRYLTGVDSTWWDVQSSKIIEYVKNLAERGEQPIKNQLYTVNLLRQPPPADSLLRNSVFIKSIKQLPTFIDTLRLLIVNVYPQAKDLREPIRGLSDFLAKNNRTLNLPSGESIDKSINDLILFKQTHQVKFASLSALQDHQKALADSIRAIDQRKGKINLSFVEQEVSVKFAFKCGLPLLVFFNHILLLFIRKKASLHKVFMDVKPKKDKKIPVENSNGSELSIHLSPTFFNFLFMHDTSAILKVINWLFFFILEIAVLLLGIAIFWYLIAFLPVSETISLVTLIIMGIFLFINIVQIFSICVRTVRIKY